ncbi:hypothetical protein MKX01_038417 [Papaver californicum]|nr:hypothetical protein MKX01_038417 [Papaver californicum]
MVFWEGYLSDEAMGTIALVVVYWLYAGVYHVLPPLDHYRLHTTKEKEARNVVPLPTVIKGVILQQSIQAAVAYSFFLIFYFNVNIFCFSIFIIANTTSSSEVVVHPSLPIQLLQFIVAMLVTDAWQYFVHRYMHQNKFLYRHIHSQHHRVVGLFLDTFGVVVSFLISGMMARTSVFFFSFTMIKAIDDHSGLCLPGYNLLQLVFPNNSAYHDIHHYGLRGVKYSYSQPFFIFSDKLLGTHMPYTLVKRPEGAFEVRPVK